MGVHTPVAVFAYDRPELLRATLQALAQCEAFNGRAVHVYCDAAANQERAAGVAAARAVARAWCRAVGARLVLRETNCGFQNITDGLSELCASEGRVISLEDDHLPAPGLLVFLDRALAALAHEERVFQVAAYRMGLSLHNVPETFFLPMPMYAGWGTWARAWQHFRWDVAADAAALSDPQVRRAFDLDDAYPASRLLARALAGTFQSYFIRWYLAMFRQGGLALCARSALVYDMGLDSGVHGLSTITTARQQFFNGAWRASESDPRSWHFPKRVAVDPAVFQQVCAGLRMRRRVP